MALKIPKPEELPKFDSPPVVETVLSVQFTPLAYFTNAHAGWYWKNYLSSDWDSIKQAPRLEDQKERFGKDRKWGSAHGIRLYTEPPAERHQISRTDHERMIQIQDTRFIYNWRMGKSGYPTFGVILPEFQQHFSDFQSFVAESNNGDLQLNQWEVTYVNHLDRGELWDTPADWKNIFPWLETPALGILQQKADGFQGEWQLTIGENLGRLRVSIKHVRVGTESGKETLALQLIARGPISPEDGINLVEGFQIGHSSIVLSFHAMTSKMAHDAWGYVKNAKIT